MEDTMYLGKTPRQENGNFILPIAKRQLLFDKKEIFSAGKDFVGNLPEEISLPYVSYLFTHQGVAELVEEIPIVRWYAEETVWNKGRNHLNGFVHDITVSLVSGTRLEFDAHKAKEEVFGHKILERVTNQYGVSTEIYWDPLYNLLLRKPNLTVTNEGVLLFYTEDRIIATLDCNCGNLVGVKGDLQVALENYKITEIKEITVAEDGSNVIKFSTSDGEEVEYKLSVLFDFFSDGKVVIKID